MEIDVGLDGVEEALEMLAKFVEAEERAIVDAM